MRRLTLLTLVLAAVLGILAHKEAPLIISPADRTLMDNVLFDFVKRNGDNCSEKQNKFKDESGKTGIKPSLDMQYFRIGINRRCSLPCYNPNGTCSSICCLIGRCLEYNYKCGCNPEINNEIMNTDNTRISFSHYVKNYMSWFMRSSCKKIAVHSDFSNNALQLFDISSEVTI